MGGEEAVRYGKRNFQASHCGAFSDPKLFEQAIFILREDALGKGGMSDRAILRQAQQAAGSYIPAGKRRRFRLGRLGLGGGRRLATGLAWVLSVLL